MNMMDRKIVASCDTASSSRTRRLSHRDLLLEKSLQDVLAFTNNPRRTASSKHYDMKYGSNRAQHMLLGCHNKNIHHNESHELRKCVKDVSKVESSECCDEVESRRSIRDSVFDNDDNFQEVDGFFVLDTRSTNDGKREGLWKSLFGGKSFLKRSHEVKALFH